MNEQDKDLAAFEEYLFSFMNEATPSTPLTGDEVIAILNNYSPPEEVSIEEKEQAVTRMKAAQARRTEIANKMHHPDQIQSVGELFQLFCEWKHIPPAWLARLLNMTVEHFEAHCREIVSPEELGKEQILSFAVLAGIGIHEILAIVETTYKRQQATAMTQSTVGRIKIYREPKAPPAFKVMESGAREQLLRLNKNETTAQPKTGWEALREEILEEAEREASLSNQPNQCFTVCDESQRQFANELLRQI